MNKQKGNAVVGLLGVIAIIAVWAATIVGWVWNIVKLFQFVGDFGVHEIVRIIGIFVFPVGAILGYF